MNVTQRIRFLLIQQGKSINQMAKDLSLGSGTFATWEKNGRTPNGDIIVQLASYFGVSTDYILGIADQPAADTTGDGLTEAERALLELYRRLTPEQQDMVNQVAKTAAAAQKAPPKPRP